MDSFNKILGRLIDNKDYTDDEVSQMSWQRKSELIQKDPVTCARNFEHMVQLSIHKNIVSKVRHISNKFLNAVEISAQEALYLVPQMPLRR